jgi:biopolymer transport protein ExbD
MAGRRIGIRMDMTPMVDVAFLLLIFFMTTTQFKPPERVGVILPGSKSEIHVPETKTIILTLNKEGQIFISDENLSQTQEVAKEDLVSAIMTWRARNPAAVVIVKGDKEADYGTVADVMNALAESKTLRFNLMTDLKMEKSKKKKPAKGGHH